MKTDNELIAEFMGGSIVEYVSYHEKLTGWINTPANDRCQYAQSHQFKYDTSWDWLMPVVDKIYKWGSVRPDYGGTIRPYKYLNDLSIMADIQQTYVAVVEFIKWYNENQKF